ncbi:unnamed protein product, partial [Lampetra planeri]
PAELGASSTSSPGLADTIPLLVGSSPFLARCHQASSSARLEVDARASSLSSAGLPPPGRLIAPSSASWLTTPDRLVAMAPRA